MELRPELLPPRDDLGALVAQVEQAFSIEAQDGAVAAAAWLRKRMDHVVSAEDLHARAGSGEARELAKSLHRPPRYELRKLDLTRDELIEVAARLFPQSSGWDPKNQGWWTDLFEANVPRPNATNAIYFPPDGMSDHDVTPEWLVDHALAYRAFEL